MENMNPTPATGVPASASDVNQPLPMSTESSSNSGKRVWIILAVVAVVVVGVIAALFGGQFFKGSFLSDLQTDRTAAFTLTWVKDQRATVPTIAYSFSYDAGKSEITKDHPLQIVGYGKPIAGAKDDKSNWIKFFSQTLNASSGFRPGETLIMKQAIDLSVVPSGAKPEDYDAVIEAQVDGTTVATGIDRAAASTNQTTTTR